MPSTLILGGARSGKSAFAQRTAEAMAAERLDSRLAYVATAEALDEEMAERIARHRAARDDRWTTVEAPLELDSVITQASDDEILVVDCLTLWLSNLLLRDADVATVTRRLLTALAQTHARLILVSNEVGLGIVPDNALARRFRDEAGRLNQSVAAAVDEVFLICAGVQMRLK